MITWLPGYQKIDLGPDGGVFDETKHPKGVIHTTEGSSLQGAEAAFKQYPPHLGYDPIKRIKHQYISLDRHSYALRGDESDDEYAIQIEIVGFAAQTHLWSNTVYQNIAEDVIGPLEKALEIPRISLTFHGQDEGMILATKYSQIRLTDSAYRSYTGWLGHQHVPAPDVHWDPGRFNIRKCFEYLEELDRLSVDRSIDMSVRLQRGDSTVTDPSGQPYGWYTYMVKYDPELTMGAIRKYMEDGPVFRSLKTAQGGVDVIPQKDLDAIPKVPDIDPTP